MARCKSCNGVFSEVYLKDGVCENCLEKEKKIIFNLSDLEKNEWNELSKKFTNITVYNFLELKDIIKTFRQKYNIEITKDDYLTIKTLLIPYIDFLSKKKSELIVKDNNGNWIVDLWHKEVDNFVETIFVPLLINNKITISQDIAKDIIYSHIGKYVKVSSINNNTKKSRWNIEIIVLIIFIIGTILFIKFLPGSKPVLPNYYYIPNNNNQYEKRFQQEEQQRKREVQEMLDELKYQQYKQNR